jgi:hypothetical protein
MLQVNVSKPYERVIWVDEKNLSKVKLGMEGVKWEIIPNDLLDKT